MDHSSIIPEASASQFLVLSVLSLSPGRRASLEKAVKKSIRKSVKPVEKEPVFVYLRAAHANGGLPELPYHCFTRKIFHLACVAKQCGWREFALFDHLSLSQLEGKIKEGTRRMLSLIQVSFRSSLNTSTTEHTVRGNFIAARQICKEVISNLASKQPQAHFELQMSDFLFRDWYYRKGLVIHDPSSPLFSPDFDSTLSSLDRTSIIDSALAKPPSLPNEIRSKILDLAEPEIPGPELISVPNLRNSERGKIQIFLLAQLQELELEELEEEIQSGIDSWNPGMFCELHKWLHAVPATRRDVAIMSERVLRTRGPSLELPFVFMYPEMWTNQKRIGVRKHHPFNPPTYRLMDLKTLLELWNDSGWTSFPKYEDWVTARMTRRLQYQEAHGLDESNEAEIIVSPYAPFEFGRPLYLEPRYEVHDAVLEVFFLTKDFSENQVEALRDELDCCDEEIGDNPLDMPKAFLFIPWDSPADATGEDMWQIMKSYFIRHHRIYHPDGRDGRDMACVDRQSFSDHTVLIVRAIWGPGDVYIGIKWGRAPAKCAHIACLGRQCGHICVHDNILGAIERDKIVMKYSYLHK